MFEKVNPAHPDKLCDRIAGAIVDIAYAQVDDPRIAVEVLLGHGICHIIAETDISLPVFEIEAAVKRIAGSSAILSRPGTRIGKTRRRSFAAFPDIHSVL